MTVQNIRAIFNLGLELNDTQELIALTELMTKSLINANKTLKLTDEEIACVREIGRWEVKEAVKLVFYK